MLNVLLVEDSDIFIKAMELTLPPLGYHVDSATSLAEAKKILAKKTPDAILLDLNLPNSQGVMTVKEIKAISKAQIIVLTGRGKEVANEVVEAGAFCLLCKGDVQPEEIDVAVRSALKVQKTFAPVERMIEKREELLRDNIEDSKNIVPK